MKTSPAYQHEHPETLSTENGVFPRPAPCTCPPKRRLCISVAVFLLAAAGLGVIVLNHFPVRREGRSSAANQIPTGTGSETLPPVSAAWKQLRMGDFGDEVRQNLVYGKYYYDSRFPGNLGLAIQYWQAALAELSGPATEELKQLIAAAEQERVARFHNDSGDIVILLKQGRTDQAVDLLERVRTNFPDITSPQYIWCSKMLYRYRQTRR